MAGIPNFGLGEIIDKTLRKRAAAAEYLKDAEVTHATIPSEVMNDVLGIQAHISELKKIRNCVEAFEKIEKYLKGLEWKFVFSTGGDEPSDTDSVYFVSEYGFSLRLKKYNLKTNDINKVVQPISEIICFEKGGKVMSLEPKLGLTTMEYLTQEFLDFQLNGEPTEVDFESKIAVARKDGEVFIVNTNDGHQHNGHAVNKIWEPINT